MRFLFNAYHVSLRTVLLIGLISLSCILYFADFSPKAERTVGEIREPIDNDTIYIPSHQHGEKFCVAYNLTKASRAFREDGLEPITFATHSTANYLKMVVDEQLKNWDGPLSLAIFIEPSTYSIIEFAYNLHRCRPEVNEKLSIHLVYRNAAFNKQCQTIPVKIIPCKMFDQLHVAVYFAKLYPPFAIYPINILRNVARKGAPSSIIMLADVEVVFSEHFALMMKPLANEYISDKTKTRFIVRRFEIEEMEMPRTHLDIKQKINKTVFEFHILTYPQGHQIDNLPKWFDISASNIQPVAEQVAYKGQRWEPQVMLHSTDPMSEEDIPIRFQDQQVLIYELCRANITLLLPSHVFNVHRGVKRRGQRKPIDDVITEYLWPFELPARTAYINRIDKMYPATKGKCGGFLVQH